MTSGAKEQIWDWCREGKIGLVKECVANDLKLIEKCDEDGRLLIHHACSTANFEMAEFLVQHNTSVTQKDDAGWSPLHIAASVGSAGILQLLIGAIHSHKLQLSAELSSCNNHGCIPLHYACSRGRLAAAKILIDEGTPISLVDCRGNSCLHKAASTGHLDICKLLLQHGIAINLQNKDGDTAIMLAISDKQDEVVDFLIKAGADIDTISNKDGFNARQIAVSVGKRI